MTQKIWAKALSPLIATLFLVGIAAVIGGIYFAWADQFAQSQSDLIIGQAEDNINCSYAGLFIRACDYNSGGVFLTLQNSGTIHFTKDLMLQLADANGNLANGSFSTDLNAGRQLNVNSTSLSNYSDFTNLEEPIAIVRVTPQDCPQKFAEVTTCA